MWKPVRDPMWSVCENMCDNYLKILFTTAHHTSSSGWLMTCLKYGTGVSAVLALCVNSDLICLWEIYIIRMPALKTRECHLIFILYALNIHWEQVRNGKTL